jgi:molecular chaperone GrpE
MEIEGPKKARELEEKILRLRADFENYKKRAEKENSALRESSKADMLNKLLPIVDEFEIAITHMNVSTDKEFKHGMEIIYSKLTELLKREGVVEMKSLGERFDPYKHDAIRQGEGEEGKIIEVVQKGYLLNGNILRHAKVVVGKGEVKENE